ncbi:MULTISPECIES: aspartyl-phosphate phosphatase Spo0E family protein [Geomicrobium]|uniref:Aspartyl-phosphate phosphatase Spo0E family protein n=1 Tax=Geomicrobium sediminis TaxID=1347788 RepID=A0ABS2P992_9BACL|nr:MULTISPECIES: aspartyl-phosphate phosphatase Spo0E family protein [Geomicrobium]MBM7631973.1 hypothetical protein [Geomicrobium sediminis]GAK00419.1 hypothetical protein JCM19055_3505 [Geomicrobium sp. JCM 19055]GAK08569.1 hypothetical protein JCM19038_2355 [Geomicrobium sp. JCM 19038]
MEQDQQEIVEQLEQLRSKMIEMAKQHGMDHPLVLKYSQEIDLMHTELLKASHQELTVVSTY